MTPPQLRYLSWLVDTRTTVVTNDGRSVAVFELQHKQDEAVLSEWAKHFRNQYCSDAQIDALRAGTGRSRAAYLREIKFPDRHQRPGPSIRSGDFAEALVADYVEYVLRYWVPRGRFADKAVRNESVKGTDIVGFRFKRPDSEDPEDCLVLCETKAQLGQSSSGNRLQAAVDGSAKDELRKAESLNAFKQRFLDRNQIDEALRIERFQDFHHRPYKEEYHAAAVLSSGHVDWDELRATTTAAHPSASTLFLMVIQGENLMELAHLLYERAADEA